MHNCLGTNRDTVDVAVADLIVGEDEDAVEPLPEGEVSLRQRLFAEHWPT